MNPAEELRMYVSRGRGQHVRYQFVDQRMDTSPGNGFFAGAGLNWNMGLSGREDFGSFETHEAYHSHLKAEHGRKSAFWSLLDC